jgi:hypothetical protein
MSCASHTRVYAVDSAVSGKEQLSQAIGSRESCCDASCAAVA